MYDDVNIFTHQQMLENIWFKWYEEDHCVYLENEKDDIVSFNQIRYLHQLQNIYFWLTGEELETKGVNLISPVG